MDVILCITNINFKANFFFYISTSKKGMLNIDIKYPSPLKSLKVYRWLFSITLIDFLAVLTSSMAVITYFDRGYASRDIHISNNIAKD